MFSGERQEHDECVLKEREWVERIREEEREGEEEEEKWQKNKILAFYIGQ